MIRVARLLVTFVLVTAGALLVAPSAMADPAEVSHVTEETFQINCNGETIFGQIEFTRVLVTLPTGDRKIEATAHGSATGERENKYVINQHQVFLIHTEGGITNSIFTINLVLVSAGSEPNLLTTFTANTATGETTFASRCVG
jgi:hypothetical protein